MEKNPGVANSFGTNQDSAWNDFAAELNALGPPRKEGTAWKRVGLLY